MRNNQLARSVATELRAELARRRLSGRQVAHHIHMPHATVTRWLNGDTPIPIDGLAMICQSLGMPTAELLKRAEMTTPPTLTEIDSVIGRYPLIYPPRDHQDHSAHPGLHRIGVNRSSIRPREDIPARTVTSLCKLAA